MSTDDSIVAETAARIFADLADPQTINRAKSGDWLAPLWRALADAGLTLAWVPEELGGAGAGIADGFEVLRVAGRFAAPIPIAETLLAGWLLARAGLASPPGSMTVMPVRPGDRITLTADGTLKGRAGGVPFAGLADNVAVLVESADGAMSVALIDAKTCRIAEGNNLAGDPCNGVTLDGVLPRELAGAPAGLDQQALMLMGGIVRSMQTAGALGAVLAMAVKYANERIAFEKPIAKFQAIQHSLARLAGEVSAALTAAGSAADAVASSDRFEEEGLFLEAAAAKIRCAEAAEAGAAIAHQVHGAIGFTSEHILHRFTMRMLSWRDDFGNESYWAAKLGERVAAAGADAFWPLLASR